MRDRVKTSNNNFRGILHCRFAVVPDSNDESKVSLGNSIYTAVPGRKKIDFYTNAQIFQMLNYPTIKLPKADDNILYIYKNYVMVLVKKTMNILMTRFDSELYHSTKEFTTWLSVNIFNVLYENWSLNTQQSYAHHHLQNTARHCLLIQEFIDPLVFLMLCTWFISCPAILQKKKYVKKQDDSFLVLARMLDWEIVMTSAIWQTSKFLCNVKIMFKSVTCKSIVSFRNGIKPFIFTCFQSIQIIYK